MTNSNTSLKYDLDLFAPKPTKKEELISEPKPNLTIVRPKKITKQEFLAQKQYNKVMIIRFLILATLIVSLIAPNICLHIKANELNHQITVISEELRMKKAEHTRLECELAAKFSPTNVQKYAESHGMVRRERYQIVYFDVGNENEIIPAE